MKPNYNKGGSGGWKGGKGGFNKGGGKSYGGGSWQKEDKGPRQMHSATCAECFVACEVPFKPNGKKPVLCRECMGPKEGGSPRFEQKRFDRPSFEKPAYRSAPAQGNEEILKQLKALNDKMDEIMDALSDLDESEV